MEKLVLKIEIVLIFSGWQVKLYRVESQSQREGEIAGVLCSQSGFQSKREAAEYAGLMVIKYWDVGMMRCSV